MITKLTLSVDENTISKAKLYAKHTGRSLSELIGNYLEALTSVNNGDNKLSPRVKKIAGSVKLPLNFDEDAELTAYLEGKHL